MDEKMKNPDAEIAGIRKVVALEIDNRGSLWVNGLLKQGWELLRYAKLRGWQKVGAGQT